LINRVVERVRTAGIRHRELRRRASAATRPPVIVVPSVFGVRLVDDRGRAIWGATSRLFVGASFCDIAARPGGYVDGFDVVPGVYRHDVFGGLVRYLAGVYGATPGEDLFVLDYDWRRPLADGALALARLVARVRGTTDDRVDLVAISSGGNVVRAFLAGGWRDDADDDDPVLDPTPRAIRRVVYLGAPQLGNFAAVGYTQDGVAMFSGGKVFSGDALQTGAPGIFDLMPAPGTPIFADSTGRALDLDHLDPDTWRGLRLRGHDRPDLAAHLARSRRMHERVTAAADTHPPCVVIAGRHKPTTARIVVGTEGVTVPCPTCGDDRERYAFAYEPGDGAVPASTMAAAPNQSADGPWWVEPSIHHRIATEPFIHPLVVEALLSPIKPVPRERYAWPRNPATRGVVPPEDDDDLPQPLA
jgi:hypothetical protein